MNTFLRSRSGLALLAFLGIATFYLVTEHTAHFFGIVPYLLLLLCPLLHLFMHGGHGDHTGHAAGTTAQSNHAGHDGPHSSHPINQAPQSQGGQR